MVPIIRDPPPTTIRHPEFAEGTSRSAARHPEPAEGSLRPPLLFREAEEEGVRGWRSNLIPERKERKLGGLLGGSSAPEATVASGAD